MKMLAIIIPYFKIDFFEETLESLAKQTDKRFHVYIGDDASPNSPESLLDKYQGKFDFTYKRFENNLGSVSLVKQWERCIDMMQDEEWFMILGDDDVIGYNLVEEFYRNLSEIKVSNVIRISAAVINEKTEILYQPSFNPKLELAKDSFLRKVQGQTRSSLSEYIFKKNCYSIFKFRDLPLAWGTDDLAVLDIADNLYIYSINTTLVLVRISKQSISGKKDNLLLKNRAILKQGKIFLREYKSFITNEQRIMIINYLEYNIFMFNLKDIRSMLNLIVLSLMYGNFHCFLNLIKKSLYTILYEGNK